MNFFFFSNKAIADLAIEDINQIRLPAAGKGDFNPLN